jgi:hypothetical protein
MLPLNVIYIMDNSGVGQGFTRPACRLLIIGLLVVFGIVGMVSACGGGGGSVTTFSSATLFSNWQKVEVPVEEMTGVPTANPTAGQTAGPTSAPTAGPTSAPKVSGDIYSVTIPNTGSGVSGLDVKFSKKFTSPPGANHLAYTISPYFTDIMATQKLTAETSFNETFHPYAPGELKRACSEHLGTRICAKGNRVAF